MTRLGRFSVVLTAVAVCGLGIGILATEIAERRGLLAALSGRSDADSPAERAARQKREQEAVAKLAAGDARKAANDMAGALEAYASALKSTPGDADILFRTAQMRTALGDHQGATADLDAAIKVRPRDAALLFARGNARAAIGMTREALGDLSGAIALLPGQASFHVARAGIFEKLGRKSEAQTERKRAAELK